MHLADRRCGERLVVETGKGALEWARELVLDDVADQRKVHGRRRRLQRRQRQAVLGGHVVAHERQHLPELHQRALHVAHLGGDALGIGASAGLVDVPTPLGVGKQAAKRGAEAAGSEPRREPAEPRDAPCPSLRARPQEQRHDRERRDQHHGAGEPEPHRGQRARVGMAVRT